MRNGKELIGRKKVLIMLFLILSIMLISSTLYGECTAPGSPPPYPQPPPAPISPYTPTQAADYQNQLSFYYSFVLPEYYNAMLVYYDLLEAYYACLENEYTTENITVVRPVAPATPPENIKNETIKAKYKNVYKKYIHSKETYKKTVEKLKRRSGEK